MGVAVFNRIYLEKKDAWVVEFPDQLIFYHDRKKKIMYSDKYDIVFADEGMNQEKFYRLVQFMIETRLAEGKLEGAEVYTKEEWESRDEQSK